MDNEKVSEYPLPLTRILSKFASVSERYYETRFYRNKNRNDSDECILCHSNRVSIITLSPEHVIIKQKKSVAAIDFKIGDHSNRLENRVSGKWKKGGQKVDHNSILCRVICTDGESYDIFACMRGIIVEINENLIANHSLLTEYPWSDGFIAIILPNRGQHLNQKYQKQSLLSSEDYCKLLLSDDVNQ